MWRWVSMMLLVALDSDVLSTSGGSLSQIPVTNCIALHTSDRKPPEMALLDEFSKTYAGNPKAAGSNPAPATNRINDLQMIFDWQLLESLTSRSQIHAFRPRP